MLKWRDYHGIIAQRTPYKSHNTKRAWFVLVFDVIMQWVYYKDITNLSLSFGVFPSHFKHAHVSPLLKKSSLPANDLTSYRSIPNLSLISKVLEKGELYRLNIHIRFQKWERKEKLRRSCDNPS